MLTSKNSRTSPILKIFTITLEQWFTYAKVPFMSSTCFPVIEVWIFRRPLSSPEFLSITTYIVQLYLPHFSLLL